jgi:hypothetical protein
MEYLRKEKYLVRLKQFARGKQVLMFQDLLIIPQFNIQHSTLLKAISSF